MRSPEHREAIVAAFALRTAGRTFDPDKRYTGKAIREFLEDLAYRIESPATQEPPSPRRRKRA